MFSFYFQFGIEHITDFEGYDHMLFLLALCAIYSLKNWKVLLVLVTAFTIGHSITLALAALGWVRLPSDLIEFLIPITIFLTAVFNIFNLNRKANYRLRYFLALSFGLIHGLGFSNYFRAILGKEGDILIPLLSFNLGVEVGQLIIVAGFLILSSIVLLLLKISQKLWTIIVSAVAAVISLYLIVETYPW